MDARIKGWVDEMMVRQGATALAESRYEEALEWACLVLAVNPQHEGAEELWEGIYGEFQTKHALEAVRAAQREETVLGRLLTRAGWRTSVIWWGDLKLNFEDDSVAMRASFLGYVREYPRSRRLKWWLEKWHWRFVAKLISRLWPTQE